MSFRQETLGEIESLYRVARIESNTDRESSLGIVSRVIMNIDIIRTLMLVQSLIVPHLLPELPELHKETE